MIFLAFLVDGPLTGKQHFLTIKRDNHVGNITFPEQQSQLIVMNVFLFLKRVKIWPLQVFTVISRP